MGIKHPGGGIIGSTLILWIPKVERCLTPDLPASQRNETSLKHAHTNFMICVAV